MSQINLKDITIVIVTYKSSQVLFKCLANIKKVQKILILDNSNDLNLKKKINLIYKNIKFYISKKNLGYAKGNNFLLKKVKTKYALLLNPDCFLAKNSMEQILYFLRSNLDKWAIVGTKKQAKITKKLYKKKINYYECDFVKGFLLLLKIDILKKINFFDENFFLYLEEIDLCKRLSKKNFKILALDNIKFTHTGEGSSKDRKEFYLIRNWHWMWSQYYFSKKHKGIIFTFIKFFPKLFYLFFKKNLSKNKIYTLRYNGLLASMLNQKSYYRG